MVNPVKQHPKSNQVCTNDSAAARAGSSARVLARAFVRHDSKRRHLARATM